jgi:hypothetical protein
MSTYSMDQVREEDVPVAERNLDLLQVPEGQEVATIVAGDSPYEIHAFFRSLPQGEKTPVTMWENTSDRKIGTADGAVPLFIGAMWVAARRRFGANCRVYDSLCTCCAGLDEVEVQAAAA